MGLAGGGVSGWAFFAIIAGALLLAAQSGVGAVSGARRAKGCGSLTGVRLDTGLCCSFFQSGFSVSFFLPSVLDFLLSCLSVSFLSPFSLFRALLCSPCAIFWDSFSLLLVAMADDRDPH